MSLEWKRWGRRGRRDGVVFGDCGSVVYPEEIKANYQLLLSMFMCVKVVAAMYHPKAWVCRHSNKTGWLDKLSLLEIAVLVIAFGLPLSARLVRRC